MTTTSKEIPMPGRREYCMTDNDLAALLEACQPVYGLLTADGLVEAADVAWCALGAKMGFDGMSVEPVDGKDHRWFTAIPTVAATALRIPERPNRDGLL